VKLVLLEILAQLDLQALRALKVLALTFLVHTTLLSSLKLRSQLETQVMLIS
jgi:hypothetical protein